MRPEMQHVLAACNKMQVKFIPVTSCHVALTKAWGTQMGFLDTPDRAAAGGGERRGSNSRPAAGQNENTDVCLYGPSAARVEDVPTSDCAHDVIVHGSMTTQMSDLQWNDLLTIPRIMFCRMRPEHVRVLCRQLWKRGQVVCALPAVADGPAGVEPMLACDIAAAAGTSGADIMRRCAQVATLPQ